MDDIIHKWISFKAIYNARIEAPRILWKCIPRSSIHQWNTLQRSLSNPVSIHASITLDWFTNLDHSMFEGWYFIIVRCSWCSSISSYSNIIFVYIYKRIICIFSSSLFFTFMKYWRIKMCIILCHLSLCIWCSSTTLFWLITTFIYLGIICRLLICSILCHLS